MRKTEQLAYKWLIEKLGKTNVRFQHNNSPDFILFGEDVSYEVKRLYGQSIWMYKSQFEKLKRLGEKCKILVFEDDNSEPVAIIPMSKIEPEKVVDNILIRIVDKKTRTKFEHIPVYSKTKQQLDEIGMKIAQNQGKKSVSYEEIIHHLVEMKNNKSLTQP